MKIATLALIMRGAGDQRDVLLAEKKRGEIGTGTLNGPGGKLEPGETLTTCVIRETWEEFRMVLDPTDLVEVAHLVFYAGGVPSFDGHIFMATRYAGTPCETDDVFEPEWYPVSALPIERMLEADRHWLPKVLAGERFTAHVYYRGNAQDFDRIEFKKRDF